MTGPEAIRTGSRRSSAVRATRSPTLRLCPWAREVDAFLGEPAEADYPKLMMTWVGTINSRPAMTRALAAVDEVRAKTTQFDTAGEVARDRLFGRGRDAA